LIDLIRFRNRHPAFGGQFLLPASAETELILEWRHEAAWASLRIDLTGLSAVIRYSTPDGERTWSLLADVEPPAAL
jgi:sucrose phosphorylase